MGKPKPKLKWAKIVVVFTEDGLKKIVHGVTCERACYGNVTMDHTIAMEKIIKALRQGEDFVIV